MEDFFFYWMHRALHHPKLYSHIHKMHHESKSTIALSAASTHPLEVAFGNLFAAKAGPILCPFKFHLSVVLIFYIYRVIESLEGHSGYEFPIGVRKFVPFGGTANYHDHHHLVNVGNYGSQLILWDSIFGTNKCYFDQIQGQQDTKLEGVKTKLKNE